MVPTGVQTSVVQTPATTAPPVVPVAHTALVVPAAHTAHVAPTFRTVPGAQAEKPDKFNGSNFKRWKQKMLFYLTTLNLDRYLKEEVPLLTVESDLQTVYVVDA